MILLNLCVILVVLVQGCGLKPSEPAFTDFSEDEDAALVKPTQLRVVSLNPTSIQFQWNDNSTGEKNFDLEMSGDNTSFSLVTTAKKDTDTLTLWLPLDDQLKYFFRVRARNLSNKVTTDSDVSYVCYYK